MQYIIFSDVHGNAEALKKLLEAEQPLKDKKFIFCGDICGYYYQTSECVELLKSIDGLIAVKGNHDQYYLEAFNDEDRTRHLVGRYGISYRSKNVCVKDYIEVLEWSKTIEDNSAQIYLQHGSPENPLEGRIYPDTCPPVSKKNAIYLMGHTHYRMIKKDKNGALWINPGSLGQPRDGKGFSYCRLDTESRNVIFRTVDIDIMNLVCQIRMNDPGNKYLEEILYRKK